MNNNKHKSSEPSSGAPSSGSGSNDTNLEALLKAVLCFKVYDKVLYYFLVKAQHSKVGMQLANLCRNFDVFT